MKIVALGDLHISLRSNEAFEIRRLEALSIELKTRTEDTIVLVGDIFDRNKPSLQEIDLFYKFVHSLPFKNIWLIDGNHDPTVFDYIPQTNFKYFDKPVEIDNMVFVGHSNLERFMSDGIFTNKSEIIFTHARCTIPPFIEEEVDFKALSKKYKLVVLGDIHKPCKVQKNVYYTYEPTNNHFVKYQKNSSGYVIVDTTNLTVERVFPELPYKDVIKVKSAKEAYEVIAKLDERNMYKVVIEAPLSDLKVMPISNVVYELIPQIDVKQQEEEKELKELVNRKVSIEDTLLQYTCDTYKFDITVMNKVKNRIMRNR